MSNLEKIAVKKSTALRCFFATLSVSRVLS